MKKQLIIALLLIGALTYTFVAYNKNKQTVSVNEVASSVDTREEAFQASQDTSESTAVESIDADISNTIIQDEDFSDIE